MKKIGHVNQGLAHVCDTNKEKKKESTLVQGIYPPQMAVWAC